jgi:hypothetical protein
MKSIHYIPVFLSLHGRAYAETCSLSKVTVVLWKSSFVNNRAPHLLLVQYLKADK